MLNGIKNIHEFTLVSRAAMLLLVMPVLLRLANIAKLVSMLTPEGRQAGDSTIELERELYLLNRVLRIFQGRGYNYSCLKRSLLLYHFMRARGIPVEISFGVKWENASLTGHSWLTDGGTPFREPEGKVEQFTEMFSLPSGTNDHKDLNINNIKFD